MSKFLMYSKCSMENNHSVIFHTPTFVKLFVYCIICWYRLQSDSGIKFLKSKKFAIEVFYPGNQQIGRGKGGVNHPVQFPAWNQSDPAALWWLTDYFLIISSQFYVYFYPPQTITWWKEGVAIFPWKCNLSTGNVECFYFLTWYWNDTF